MIGCDNDECPYQWVSTHFIAFLCLFAFESGTFTFTDPHEHLFSNYTGAYLPIGLPFRFASIPEASAFFTSQSYEHKYTLPRIIDRYFISPSMLFLELWLRFWGGR